MTNIEKYIASSEFMYNVTSLYSAYQVGVFFQASQLVGDLQAARTQLLASARSYNATHSQGAAMMKDDLDKHIIAPIQDELHRQVCAETRGNMARTRRLIETQALIAVKNLRERYDEEFADRYFKAATEPIEILGIIPIQGLVGSAKNLKETMDYERRHFLLPLYKDRVRAAVKSVIQRLETPPSCTNVNQGDLCESAESVESVESVEW